MKGIWLDTNDNNIPDFFYKFAKNAVKNKGVITNENGFTPANYTPTVGYTVIGVIEIPNGAIIFSTNNTLSRIDRYTESTNLKTNVLSEDLGFSTSFPIKGVFQKNYLDQIIIAWTDNNIPAMILNIDDVPSPFDANELLLFPEVIIPTIVTSVQDTGGSLFSGTYYITVKYKDDDNTQTSYLDITNPIYISDDIQSDGFDDYDGCIANAGTSKAIGITLTNVDTRFDKIIITVISKISGIITGYNVKELPVSSTVSTVITTLINTSPVILNELLIKSISYNKVKTIGQISDRLAIGGLETQDEIDFQKYANNIKINYVSKIKTVTNFTGSSKVHANNSLEKGFLHGEVYAFYIVFKLKNGSYSRAFHIPGRERVGNIHIGGIERFETAIFTASGTNNNSLINTGVETDFSPDYSLGNSVKYFQTRDTSNNDDADTNMGFWENQNEIYPDDFVVWDASGEIDNFSGEKVRHHRFPTIQTMDLILGDAGYGKTTLDILGISISDVYIPTAIKALIQGWEIYYAKRSINNSTILGQSNLQFAGIAENGTSAVNPTYIRTTGGNWGLDNYTGESDRQVEINKDYIRFNGFDVLFDHPTLNPSYITNQLKLVNTAVGDLPETLVTPPESGYIGTGDAQKTKWYLLNYPNDGSVEAVSDEDYLRKVSNPRYVAENISTDGIENRGGDETLLLEITNGDTLDIDATTKIGQGGVFYEETYLMNLNQYKQDIYDNFYSQELIGTGKTQTSLSTTTLSNIYHGDIFLTDYTQFTTAPVDATDGLNPEDFSNPRSTKIIRRFICESVNNIGLRNEIDGDVQSNYYPKSEIVYLEEYDIHKKLSLSYNKDYTSLNDLNQVFPFNPYETFINSFPFRIALSKKSLREEKATSWKSWLANDYYEMKKNKGKIVNLQEFNDKLIIQMENACFITRDKAQLQTDDLKVIIGSGEIFEVEPVEIIPTDKGYVGTQHPFASFVSKIGYFVADVQQGKFFLFKDGIDEISQYGIKTFLRDNFKGLSLTELAITARYDEYYERLIVSVTNGSSSFTLSYLPDEKAWFSFHDYSPTFLFTTRSKLYSIKSNDLYIHNTGEKGIFYEATPFPLIIDVPFNENLLQGKQLYSVSWLAEVKNEDNIFLKDETFNFITLYNNYRCSGRIQIDQGLTFDIARFDNASYANYEWNFNRLRDKVADKDEEFIDTIFNDFAVITGNISSTQVWFNQQWLSGKYFICKLEYSNTDNNTITIYNISPLVKDYIR